MFLTFKHSWRVTDLYINQPVKNLKFHLPLTTCIVLKILQISTEYGVWTHTRKDNDSGAGEFGGFFTEVIYSI